MGDTRRVRFAVFGERVAPINKPLYARAGEIALKIRLERNGVAVTVGITARFVLLCIPGDDLIWIRCDDDLLPIKIVFPAAVERRFVGTAIGLLGESADGRRCKAHQYDAKAGF